MKAYLIAITLFIIGFNMEITAQENDTIPRKKITIPKILEAPKIDGVLDDAAWQNAPIANNFVERQPNNGRPIPDSLRTEVKIIYDDIGIYFGATMYDSEPDKILKELTERDAIGNDDFFFILLNGYNDRQQSLQFIVTAAGVQYDAKMTLNGEDASWNAVWYSNIKINEDNWTAEIFIPYSELRFPAKDIQTWGLNMEREFRRTRTRYSWSPVDNTKGYFSIYDGEIYGINNIKTPVRLSLQPYFSTYFNSFDGEDEVTVNGGMDIKYGINDAFTLDAVLIPDFGQTKFDDAVLNLSAFETQFQEQRSFFTEGTELFGKGGLFYSRRIGGYPTGSVTLTENEELERFPASVELLNALKLSGRTSGGLGIGVFNAITKKARAEIRNTETNQTRKEVVEPIANFNVVVLDQRFGENSSVSFVNTNVLREGSYRDANASGIYTDITNKKNTINYWGGAEANWVFRPDSDTFGTEGNLGIAKIHGKHRLTASTFFRTKDYNIDDLGYTGSTNYINYYGYYGYRYLQPKGFLNNMYLNFNLNYNRRLEPDLYNSFNFNFNSSFTTTKFFAFGGGFEMTPFGKNDIYEPRIDGWYVKEPEYYDFWVWISTDYRKKLALDITIDNYKWNETGRNKLYLQFAPQYRVSDKWKIYLNNNITFSTNEKGFVNYMDNEIIFGRRDRNTIVSSLESQYIFNNSMSLHFAFRHYFSEVSYNKFYTLQPDGDLADNNLYSSGHDTSYNNWNIDLRYTWWFAPGSQLTLLYRNTIDSFVRESDLDFSENFDNLFNEPQLHSLSLRITYYLDYNRIKNWITPKHDTQTGSYKMKKQTMGMSGRNG